MSLKIKYDIRPDQRKLLVKALSDILGATPKYLRAPSFKYEVGEYMVDTDSTVICPASATEESAQALIQDLNNKGYTGELVAETASIPEGEPLTISIPIKRLDDSHAALLEQIVSSKRCLIMKALGSQNLNVEKAEDKWSFPWFYLTGATGEADAYAKFVECLVNYARNATRVVASEKTTSNERLSMRLFLVHIGMIGDEYKQARKILTRNLSGNASWMNGKPENKEVTE